MKKTVTWIGLLLAVWFFWGIPPASGRDKFQPDEPDEYQFDLSEIDREIKKKPYQFGGFLEFRPVLLGQNSDGAFNKLRFYNRDEDAILTQNNLGLRLEGSYRKGAAEIYLRTDSLLWHDYRGWDADMVLQEGYLALKPSPRFGIEAGKRVLAWGKGYAFNPVAFVSRQKDADNPTEALEGYYLVTADLIRSFKGPLQTLALTTVILPVSGAVNDNFGRVDHLNLAAKLYLLLWDTDLDFIFFTGGSRTTRYGFDFSRNILSNFEIHGELAWITDFTKKSIDPQANLTTREEDVLSTVIGLRYLTANDVTIIMEYYHNGGGQEENDAENFYTYVDQAYDQFVAGAGDAKLKKAARLSQTTLAPSKPMRDYLYFRASWKEPFDLLYVTPALAALCNLNDRSLSLTPEVLYSPKTNLEFKLRTTLLIGHSHTEYGAKQNAYRLELRARYFF